MNRHYKKLSNKARTELQNFLVDSKDKDKSGAYLLPERKYRRLYFKYVAKARDCSIRFKRSSKIAAIATGLFRRYDVESGRQINTRF